MDEQQFLTRIRKAVSRTVPHFGELMNDHVKGMQQHGAPTGPMNSPEGSDDAPQHLGEMLGLPDPADQEGLAEHWAREYSRLGGRPRLERSLSAAADAVVRTLQDILAQRGGYCVLTRHPLLQELGLETALSKVGVEVRTYSGLDDRQVLAGATVGVTVASAAIAETGTLVLDSIGVQGRSSSLLPPVHVAIVPLGSLYPGVAGWLCARGERFMRGEEMPSSLVFATGPSRSADIAGDLALGVHGPGEVHAVLLLA